jgi:predicted HicB family RNase H-like nuclease
MSAPTTSEHVGNRHFAALSLDTVRKHSGTWVQRLPEQLHYQLKAIARQELISMNLLIASILAGGVKRNVAPSDVKPSVKKMEKRRTAAAA